MAVANVLSTQITLSALSVAFIQWLKNRSWFPWINKESKAMSRVASGLLSIASAIGIHMTWTHGDLPGTYLLSVSGVTLVGIASGAWQVAKSFVFNEIIYQQTANKTNGAPAAKS